MTTKIKQPTKICPHCIGSEQMDKGDELEDSTRRLLDMEVTDCVCPRCLYVEKGKKATKPEEAI